VRTKMLSTPCSGFRKASSLPSGLNAGAAYSGLPKRTSRGINSSDVVRPILRLDMSLLQLLDPAPEQSCLAFPRSATAGRRLRETNVDDAGDENEKPATPLAAASRRKHLYVNQLHFAIQNAQYIQIHACACTCIRTGIDSQAHSYNLCQVESTEPDWTGYSCTYIPVHLHICIYIHTTYIHLYINALPRAARTSVAVAYILPLSGSTALFYTSSVSPAHTNSAVPLDENPERTRKIFFLIKKLVEIFSFLLI